MILFFYENPGKQFPGFVFASIFFEISLNNYTNFKFLKQYKPNKIKVPKFCEAEGFYTTPNRSKNIGQIKGKNTQPELKLRKVLWSLGYRYGINVKQLPGPPDMFFTRHKLAIFIDGEFWHGFRWEEKKNQLKANRDFWIPKIERNMQRDWENNKALIEMGYTVMRFWQKEIQKDFTNCLAQIAHFIDDK